MTDTKNTSILTALEEISEAAPPEGLSLKQLFHALDERAFGAILFAMAMPCCIPFLYLVPQIVALPMAALAFQMLIGRSEPWLPGKTGDRMIDRQGLIKTAKGGRRFFGWAEKIARPRLTFLTGPTAERLIALFLTVFCFSILVPLPGTNTVPGFGVATVAFGLMARDGLMTLAGLLIGSAWISALIFVAIGGAAWVTGILTGLFGS